MHYLIQNSFTFDFKSLDLHLCLYSTRLMRPQILHAACFIRVDLKWMGKD